LVFAQKLFPGQAKVTIESPPLECVVKDRPYKVSIRIEGPDTAVLQDIETTMVSAQARACCRTGRWSSAPATSPTANWPAAPTAGCRAGAASSARPPAEPGRAGRGDFV